MLLGTEVVLVGFLPLEINNLLPRSKQAFSELEHLPWHFVIPDSLAILAIQIGSLLFSTELLNDDLCKHGSLATTSRL